MSSQQEQTTSVRQAERFVAHQLTQASGRVRTLDLTAAALVLLVATLLYALAVGLADLTFGLSMQTRLALLVGYGFVVLLYVAGTLLLFWRRRVNPYYAAHQLEKSLPDAKGSVINWLDLRERPLPAAIRATLGTRAARDLGRADVEQAISGRRNLYLAALVAGLLVGLIGLFLSGPGRFSSLLARTFAPFSERVIPTQTDILLIEPAEGNLNVPVNQKMFFRVQVTGRVPAVNQADSVRLLFRYNRADPYARQPLQRDANDEWTAVFLPDQVQNGFWYRIAAGDAQTPEYQVRVHSFPQVVRFDLLFHYRPYLHLADRKDHYPNQRAVLPQIKDYRGTQVTLTLKTNRALQEGGLELEQGGVVRDLPGSILPNDPEAFRVAFVLEHSGTFRVRFRARDGEMNTDRAAYPLEVLADRAPVVVLDKPGKDVRLPANGTLRLHGSATDDFGINRLTLQLRVSKGERRPELSPKIYRKGKSFQLAGGRYPDRLDYEDFVPLDQLQTAKGAAFPLAAGMELEYWLEARDNCDYPDPAGHVGRSKKYKVVIGEPDKDKKKQQQERSQAQQQQKEQQQKQDKDLARQNQKAEQQERKQQEARDKQDPARQAKRRQQQKDFEKKAEDVAKALGQKERKENQHDQAKGAEPQPNKGDARGKGPSSPKAGQGAPKQAPQAGQEKACTAKGEGKSGNGHASGQAKDAGQKEQPQQAQAHGDARGDNGKPSQAKAKGERPGGEQAAASSKSAGQPPQGAQPGSAKQGEGQKADAAQAKREGAATPERSSSQAQAKGQAPAPTPGARKKGAQESGEPGRVSTRSSGEPGQASARSPGEPGHAKENKGQDHTAQGTAKNQGNPKQAGRPPGQARAGNESPKQDTAKGQGTPSKGQATAKGQAKGRWRQGTLGGSGAPEDDLRGSVRDPEAARRAGELHLEELKKKLTPDVLKRLKWTEKDRDEFLKEARAYQEWLRLHGKDTGKEKLAGGQSVLPSSGAREVGPGVNPLRDPLDSLHVLPPPEFRDAFRRFSSNPAGKSGP
jgi:collagen type III alpha